MNRCKYHDPVRNQCGSGDRESWVCEGEGCKVQRPHDAAFRGRLPDGSLPGAVVPGGETKGL